MARERSMDSTDGAASDEPDGAVRREETMGIGGRKNKNPATQWRGKVDVRVSAQYASAFPSVKE